MASLHQFYQQTGETKYPRGGESCCLGRGGKMKICPSPTPPVLPQPVGKERSDLGQPHPGSLLPWRGCGLPASPWASRSCRLCCCCSRYITKGCRTLQSFSLLHISATRLPSFQLQPGSCLLHPCLRLATGCCKIKVLIAMVALLFLHAALITQPKGGGVGWACCLVRRECLCSEVC